MTWSAGNAGVRSVEKNEAEYGSDTRGENGVSWGVGWGELTA